MFTDAFATDAQGVFAFLCKFGIPKCVCVLSRVTLESVPLDEHELRGVLKVTCFLPGISV